MVFGKSFLRSLKKHVHPPPPPPGPWIINLRRRNRYSPPTWFLHDCIPHALENDDYWRKTKFFFHFIKNVQQRQKDLHSPVRHKSLIGQKSQGL